MDVRLPLLLAAALAQERLLLEGRALGTTWTLEVARAAEVADPEALAAELAGVLREVDDSLSTWHDSELTRFNALRDVEWHAASPSLVALLEVAAGLHRRSAGAFDPTVAPLVDLYGFGPRARAGPPGEAERAAAARRVGLERIEARRDPPALRKRAPDVELDLSAIGKGDALDRMAARLDARGLSDWRLELGGEQLVRGGAADGRAWIVALEAPQGGVARRIALPPRAALSTSGDVSNVWQLDGGRQSHLLDPRTGRPAAHELALVFVLASDARSADGWSTALFVAGPEEGLALAQREGIAARFVVRDGTAWRELTTAGFARHLLDDGPPADAAGADGTVAGFALQLLLAAALFCASAGALAWRARTGRTADCGGCPGAGAGAGCAALGARAQKRSETCTPAAPGSTYGPALHCSERDAASGG